MDKYKIADSAIYKKYVEKFCEYGMAYFCDGTPNLSMCEERDNPKPLKTCKYINSMNCPVRHEYESRSLSIAKKEEQNKISV